MHKIVIHLIRFAINHYCLYIIFTHNELLLNHTLLFYFLNTFKSKDINRCHLIQSPTAKETKIHKNSQILDNQEPITAAA